MPAANFLFHSLFYVTAFAICPFVPRKWVQIEKRGAKEKRKKREKAKKKCKFSATRRSYSGQSLIFLKNADWQGEWRGHGIAAAAVAAAAVAVAVDAVAAVAATADASFFLLFTHCESPGVARLPTSA